MKLQGILVSLPLIASLGCNALGTVIVPGHYRSQVKDDESLKIFFLADDPGPPSGVPEDGYQSLLATAAAAAIPLLISGVQKGIEAESKRYAASYSARDSGALATCKASGARVPATTIRIQRTAAIPENPWQGFITMFGYEPKQAPVLTLDLALEGTEPNSLAIRLKPVALYVAGTKSKVASWSLWPWQLPATLVWGPWQLLDSDIKKVDMNVQLAFEAITVDSKTKQPKLKEIVTLDFPIGKFEPFNGPLDLDLRAVKRLPKEIEEAEANAEAAADAKAAADALAALKAELEKRRAAQEKASRRLAKLDSPYIPNPLHGFQCPEPDPNSPPSESFIPANARVTIVEANDLGDVIAKGAEKVKDEKDDLADKLLEALGLKEEENREGEGEGG